MWSTPRSARSPFPVRRSASTTPPTPAGATSTWPRPRSTSTALRSAPGSPRTADQVRVLIALGGNAMTAPDGSARPDDQQRAITAAMETVADLVAAGTEVVLTHGNG